MSRYKREDYEDLDEYEDEDQEEEEVVGEDEYEDEEEAPPQPTQQELEYLELRKHLKDSIRKQMKKENGSSLGHSQEKKKKLPYDNYGSFFGPSQPVIAPRVIQESMSLLENERLTAKIPKPNQSNNIASTSSGGGSRNRVHDSRPKVVHELKNKVQNLKVARDYSFLLSDDAELPAPSRDPPRNISGGPSSDARSAQVQPKNKQLFNSGRQVSNVSRQIHNGGRQVHNGSRQVANGSRKESNGSRQISNGREEKKNVSSSGQMHPRAGPHKLNSVSRPISRPVDSRKQFANNNGSGPGRPLDSKPLPSGTIQKKAPLAGTKSVVHNLPKPSSMKLQSSASKQQLVSKQSSASKQLLGQRQGYQDPSKGKILSKPPVVSSKPQIGKPSTNIPSRPTLQKDRLNKRPARPYSDDEDDIGGGSGITSMIQRLMGYNPNKYKGHDSDDSDMEANFDDILKEEQRSERIARMEDEEELRRIEEEEKREMLRKEAKKRKLSHR